MKKKYLTIFLAFSISLMAHSQYTTLAGGSQVCEEPSNLVLVDVTDSTLEVSWDASPDEMNGYEWAIFGDGADPVVDTPVFSGNVQTGITDLVVSGLYQNIEYDFYIKTLCDAGDESDWSLKLDFMTLPQPCAPPTDITVDSFSDTSASFSWTLSVNDADAEEYGWAIFNEGDVPFVDSPLQGAYIATGIDDVLISGLSPNTTYDFYIYLICDWGPYIISDLVGPITFTTTSLGLEDNKLENFKFYPNPSANHIFLEANAPIDRVEIFSVTGKKVIEKERLINLFQMDISSLKTGLFLMKVLIDNEVGYYRFVKK